jgi:hypothetical protein
VAKGRAVRRDETAAATTSRRKGTATAGERRRLRGGGAEGFREVWWWWGVEWRREWEAVSWRRTDPCVRGARAKGQRILQTVGSWSQLMLWEFVVCRAFETDRVMGVRFFSGQT